MSHFVAVSISITIFCLLYHTQCYNLEESELKSLEMFQFLNAIRVDPYGAFKAEASIGDLLDSDLGRQELKASAKRFTQLYQYQLLSSEWRNFKDHQELYKTMFGTYLSLGLVQRWPMYYYNGKEIVLIPEEIRIESDGSPDLGPPVPQFENFHKLLDNENVYRPPSIFDIEARWIKGTPDRLKKRYFYELNHIIPLSLLVNLCRVFSETWDILSQNERKALSAPFRIFKAVEKSHEVVNIGIKLSYEKLDGDYDKLKQMFLEESDFEYYIVKHVLWAPGNLFYGFKNRAGSGKHAFELGSQVIIGRRLFAKAYSIYNRMVDLMDRVQHVKSNKTLVAEMIDILVEFIYFGQERSTPYQIDWKQWKYMEVLYQWTLKSEKEYLRLLNSLNETKKLEDVDDRLAVASIMNSRCNTSRNKVILNATEYKKFEYFQTKSVFLNKNEAVAALEGLSKKFPTHVPSLAELVEFVHNETKNYYDQQCNEENLICSKANALCSYDVNLSCYQYCPENLTKENFIATPNIYDWCNGTRFENKYQITTDSVLVHMMSFNTTKTKALNEQIYHNLYREYQDSAFEEKLDFPQYLAVSLRKFNTTVNKISNEVCKAEVNENK